MEKAKKIAFKTLSLSIGIACDAALIHNFFRQDGWNLYCQRYITLWKVFSWVVVFFSVLVIILAVACERDKELRKKQRKTIEEAFKDSLSSKIFRWVDTYPMIIFVGVFVGDYNLFASWSILAMLGALGRHIVGTWKKEDDESGTGTDLEKFHSRASLN